MSFVENEGTLFLCVVFWAFLFCFPEKDSWFPGRRQMPTLTWERDSTINFLSTISFSRITYCTFKSELLYFKTWAQGSHVLGCKWLIITKSFDIGPPDHLSSQFLQSNPLGQVQQLKLHPLKVFLPLTGWHCYSTIPTEIDLLVKE